MSAQSQQSPLPKAAPARSMTGYARVRRSCEDYEVVVSVKTVNHRSLDLHFQGPSELDPLEQDLRAAVRRKLVRGHVEVRIGLTRDAATSGLALNRPLLASYVGAFRHAAAELGVDSTPDLNAAFRMPGMFAESAETELSPAVRREVASMLDEALDQLNQFREREGGEIAASMMHHNDNIHRCASELAEIRSRALPLLQARLHERLRELLKGTLPDPQRLVQEVAILADRSDVSEEISRLEIHSEQLSQLLVGGGEIGKKLDFLLQEMNRETNTVLSKTTGIGEIGLRITELALAAKADIEKIREQSLNLE